LVLQLKQFFYLFFLVSFLQKGLVIFVEIFTKIIPLSNKNTKSEDFYLRFEEQLLESQDWPGMYMYKFIVKDGSDEINQLKKILDNYNGNSSFKLSSTNKFISVTFEHFASSPADVIKVYKEVSVIDDIISL